MNRYFFKKNINTVKDVEARETVPFFELILKGKKIKFSQFWTLKISKIPVFNNVWSQNLMKARVSKFLSLIFKKECLELGHCTPL